MDYIDFVDPTDPSVLFSDIPFAVDVDGWGCGCDSRYNNPTYDRILTFLYDDDKDSVYDLSTCESASREVHLFILIHIIRRSILLFSKQPGLRLD